jgi:hypothetical protein
MDKVHKPITTQYYPPSSKPFRIYHVIIAGWHMTTCVQPNKNWRTIIRVPNVVHIHVFALRRYVLLPTTAHSIFCSYMFRLHIVHGCLMMATKYSRNM